MRLKVCWGPKWKEWFYRRYTIEELSIRQITIKIRNANLNRKDFKDISRETVRARLKEYGILIRSSSEAGIIVGKELGAAYRNEEYLREKYLKEELSIRQIAKVNKASAVTILKWMQKLNVPRRKRSKKQSIE